MLIQGGMRLPVEDVIFKSPSSKGGDRGKFAQSCASASSLDPSRATRLFVGLSANCFAHGSYPATVLVCGVIICGPRAAPQCRDVEQLGSCGTTAS